MKVYRYPSSSPFDAVLVDEKTIPENIKNDKISFDISLDKYAERKSGIQVEFSLDDYSSLQTQILKAFQDELGKLKKECEELKLKNAALTKIIPISNNVIRSAQIHKYEKEDIDYMSHCFRSISMTNPELIPKHIEGDTNLKSIYRKLEKISQEPWTMR